MRTVSGALAAALDAGTFSAVADLYTLTLKGGAVYRWAAADVDVVAGGNTFTRCGANGAPLIRRERVRMAAKLEVDELSVTLLCGDGEAKLGATPIVHVALAQGLDGARLQLDIAFLVGSSWETVDSWFVGTVSAKPSSTWVRLLVRSDLEDLAKPLPRNTYQAQCGWALYGEGCGVSKAAFAAAMVVGAGVTATTVPATGAQGGGWFNGGFIHFTSGVLSGYRTTVKDWQTGGVFTLGHPLPAIPSAGDTFTAYPGCSKEAATCSAKFANLTRFRGYPYIPRSTSTVIGGSTQPPVSPGTQAGRGSRDNDRPPRQAP